MDILNNESIWNIGTGLFQNGLLAFLIHTMFVLLTGFLLGRLLKRTIARQTATFDTKHNLLIQYIGKTLKTVLYVVVIFSILTQIKVFENLSKVALSATSILAVGVSLAAQETFSSFISGFFIAMYHPFKVGDNIVLKEKGIAGRVVDITLRHTTLITAENTNIMIPNSTMNSAILENRQFGQDRYTKFESIGIAYNSDLHLVRKIINDVLASTDGIEDTRTPYEIEKNADLVDVRLESFQDSSIEIKFPIHVKQYSEYFTVSSKVRQSILEQFQENGIEIPYPMMTVQTKM